MKVTRRTGSLVIVLVIFAAIVLGTALAAIAIDKSEIPMLQQHAAEAAGEEYVHGSNIGRTPSGNDVTTGEQLVNAINNNNNVNLLNDVSIPSGSFGSIAVYSGTIYGNGHKITINVPDSSGKNDRDKQFFGGLMGELKDGGAIYDCTFDIGSGDYKGGKNADTFFGAVAGSIYNATVENVTVNILPGTDFRIYCYGSSQRVGIGMLSGYAGKVTIRNVTINNNGGTYRAGFSDENFETIDTDANPSTVANLVSFYEENTSNTLENIIIKGSTSSTTFNGEFASNLGLLTSGATVSVGNYYNSFRGTFSATYGACAAFARLDGGSANIDTYIEYYNDENNHVAGYRNYNANITEKLSLSSGGNNGENENLEILFDPATDNYDNSLVLAFKNRTFDSNKLYTYNLTSRNGTIFSYTESFDNSVVFAGLPIASIWNDLKWGQSSYSRGDGWFTYTGPQQTEYEKLPALTEYEHGYVEGNNPEGTAINSGTEFENIFASNEAYGDSTKNYYLTDDIIITGFTGYGSDDGFKGTLDGNGHTIYIYAARTGLSAENIGGLMGKINGGTVKNLRVALVNDLNISTSAPSKTNTALGIGMITGWLTGNGLIENCNVVIKEGVTVYGAADNQDCTVAGVAGVMTGRGRVFNTTVQLDGTLKVKRSYPFIAGFVGLSEKPNFESDSVNKIPFEFKNIVFKGIGSFAGIAENTGGENVNLAAVTITPNVTQNVGQWIDMDGVIYDFSEDYWNEAASSNDIPSGYGLISQNFASDNPGELKLKPTTINGIKYIDYKNLYRATEYAPVKTSGAGDSGNTAYNIPINNTIEVTVSSAAGGTISDISVNAYFRPGSDGNITLVASGTGVSGFNGVLKEKGATIGEGKDSIPAAAKDGDNLVLEMPKADVVSASDTSVGLEEAKTVTLTTDINKSFTYSGSSQPRKVYLKYGESSISDYTVTYAAESGSELSDGSPVNAGSYYISVVALTENAGDYYFFDAASNTLSKSYTYASADENINKFVIKPAEVNLAFVSGSMTVTYDAKAVENPEVSVSEGTFGLDALGKLTYVWMNADGTTLPANPTNAGRYQVMISAVANPNFTVGGAAASGNDFTIKAKEVTLSVEEGGTSFAFAQDTGALTDENYEDIGSYSFSVTGFVEGDDDNSGYTASITTTEGDPDPSFITENTTDGTTGTSYLSAGGYIATVVLFSKNYTFGSDNTFTFEVTKNESANTWITEYARDGWTYYSNPSKETMPVARFGSPAITYSNGNEDFSNTTAQGTYTVNVSVAETDNYGALTKEYSFTVSALDVTVALSAADTVYDGQPYEASNISITLTATVNGKETTYTSADNSSDDVSTLLRNYGWKHSAEGVTETKEEGLPTNAGTYTLYIHNYSNNNVNVTGTLNCTATIAKAEVIFSAEKAGDAKLVYGTVPTDFNSLVTVTASGGINLDADGWSYTVKPSVGNDEYVATTNAGTTVTLTVQVDVTDPNHTAVQPAEILTLVIQKADIGEISVTNFDSVTIDFTSYKGFVYGQAKALEFDNIPADLTVTPVYTYAVQGGAQIGNFDILTANSGIYTVTVSISGDVNYNDKTSEAIEFAIAKADQSVTVSIDGWTYDNTANEPQIEGIQESATTTVSYSGTTNAGTEYSSTTVPEEAGTYTVTVSWEETTNYTAGSAKSEAFTIKRANGFANISVNGTPYTKTVTAYYTGSAQTFTVTVEGHDGGAIYIDGKQSSTMNYRLTNAGKTTIEVNVAQTANYNEATATAEIEILRAVIESVTLGTTEFDFGTLNTENANDAATYGTPGVTFVNGKGSPEFTYSLAYSKTEKGNDEITYISFGTYTLTMKLTGETATNFVFDGGTATVQVTKGENTWISQDKIVDYVFGFEGKAVKGTAKFGTAAVTYYRGDVKGQADKGDALEFSFGPREEDAGTYTAVVSVAANGNNYDEIFYEDVFVVKKHRLNITELKISGTEESGTADGFTVTYAPDMRLSATVKVGSAEGYAGNYSDLLGKQDTRTYLFERSTAGSNVFTDGFPKDAGKYTVRFKGMELDEEYNIDNFEFVSVPSVTLTINRAEITVTAYIPENAVVYGMTAEEIRSRIILTPEEGVTLGEVGVTLGDVKVTYNNGTAYDNTVDAGTELTISVVSVNAENKNYIAKFVGGVLTPIVQQATLNVSAEGPSSVLSANFEPGKFDRYAAITAKWNGKIVTASEYFDVTLSGYEGDVAGMTPEENFANREIGTYTFTASLNEKYQINFVIYPETIVYELTLAKNTVKLTVSIGNWTYGASPATPEFTATVTDEKGQEIDILQIVGQSITVKYSNDSGDDLPGQPTDAGTYTLTANIVGHHDYVAENAATAEFTISPAEVKFVATLAEGAELVYGIVPKDFNSLVTVTASGGINLGADGWGYTVTAAGDYTATTNAGTTVTLTVKFFVTDPNHTTVQPDKTLALEIQKAEQSVDVSIDGWTYGGQAKEPDIDGIKENAVTTVTYSGTTNAGVKYSSETAPTAAGSYTVTVSWAETTNYTAGEAEPVAFTVEKAKLTKPTKNGNTFTYTGAEQTYTPDGFDSDTMTISGNVQTNAGNYTVTVSVSNKYNYVWADDTDTDIEFSFVIGKADQSVTVSIDGGGWTYGGQAKEPDIDGIKENAVTTVTYSGTTNAGVKYSSETAPTAAGSYTVTVSWAETTNYTAGEAEPVAFTVEKAKLTKPTKNGNTFTYTGAEQTYTPDGFDSDTMTISGNVQTNAGNYTVTVSVTDKYNYVWADSSDTDIEFTFVVGKAEQSVNVSIADWTYGDTAKEYAVEGIMENADYTVSYSGDGYSADTAPVNAGNYTLTITVDATANYNAAVASVEFTIAPKELHVSDSVMIIEAEYGELTLDDISSDEAIMAVIGDYTAIFDGLVYDDVLTPDDFTLTAAEDYSDLVADGFMAVADYSIKVALNATLTNYVVPESGLENITFRVVKAANSIGRYSVSGWTYLDVRSEYIPAFSAAVFGTVVGSFFDENGTEIAVDDFGATTPAGTYTFRLSVADSDNYSGATRTGSFVIDKLIVVAELTATDVTYDGAVYDGISYTLSPDVSDYIGTVGYEYSENGSAFRKGLPTDAGNYSVRIGEYSDSDNIELRAETVDFQINPAPMHFTVTGVDGASIEYGTAIADIDVNALIVSVIPDSDVGGFDFTVSLITANGTAYRPGLYAGTTLYATVDITLDSNNYYPVVDTAIEMLPKVNITKVSHDMVFEISDEIITDGSSATVIEGSANTVIDAISYYMAINDIQYYEYHITVDGEEYSRNFVWAPGSHTVEVRLSGNHEGSTQFTVVIEENPDAVDRAPFIPKTVVGEVLESINFTWASAVSIAFGVAVAVLIILFFGLRRAKRK